MSDTEEPSFDIKTIEAMNAKAIENQFFTPDHVYIDLSLMKDYPVGVMFADAIQHRGQAHFEKLQADLMTVIDAYQSRRYDTVDEYLGSLGYTDQTIAELLKDNLDHDQVFLVAPTTRFFNTLISHTLRNQNNSGPANKFHRRQIDKRHYTLDAVKVTYYLNTFPLTLSHAFMNQLAPELGEAFGVDIQFINKDPSTFDKQDWDSWLGKIDCFYLDSIGQFLKSPYMHKKQGDMEFCGVYFFVRKRFPTSSIEAMRHVDFEQQIQAITAQISMFCDFEWLQNNEVRLTDDAKETSAPEDSPDQPDGTPS